MSGVPAPIFLPTERGCPVRKDDRRAIKPRQIKIGFVGRHAQLASR